MAYSNDIVLSVIIPTCNRNDTLPRAIYSVLGQHISDIEVIIVNDTDIPIPDDILAIGQSNPVFFFTNPGKHGAANTRNYGVSLANGKYITFLDDDDIYLPGRLDTMLLHMKQNKYIIISSGRFVECDNFKSIVLQENQIFGEFNFKKIQFGNDIDIGFMMRKDAFINLGGFDITLRALEDWDFILRALKLGDGFKIHRFDYVVNRTEGAARVSLGEAQGYLELLKK